MMLREPPDLRIHGFGTFELFVKGVHVGEAIWRSKKAQLLFYYLLTFKGEKVSRDQLLGLLWPDEDRSVANNRLHGALHCLRRVLQPYLQVSQLPGYVKYAGGDYWLEFDGSCWFDVDAFEGFVNEGDRLADKEPAAALVRYRQALPLYRGDYLRELTYEWAADRRDRLRRTYLTTALRTAKLLAELEANVNAAVQVLQQALSVDPYQEELHHILMELLISAERRTEATLHYHRLVKMLDEEFGLAPNPETQALFANVRGETQVGADSPLQTRHDPDKEFTPYICNREMFDAIHALALRRQKRYSAPSSILTITAAFGKATKGQLSAIFQRLQTMLRVGDVLCHDHDRILVQLPYTGKAGAEIVKRRIDNVLQENTAPPMIVRATVFEELVENKEATRS